MSEILKPDICVIGAGSGGLSVAAAAAAMGVSVVLVERGDMGGDCLNHGCIPSKAMIAAAGAAQTMRDSSKFGLAEAEPKINFLKLRAHIRGVKAAIAPNDSQERFVAMGVRVIRASARFVSRTCCEAGGYSIQARRFVVATGSRPSTLAIPGIDLVCPLTNETVFDLAQLPGRLIIVGAGAVGVELGQAFRRLGAEVTILEAGKALGKIDPELSSPVLQRLAREGVILRENAEILRIEPRGTGMRLFLARQTIEETVDGSHLLIAAGRKPNVDGLGLEQAGVKFDATGIKVNSGLRTSNSKIYAVGDVTGLGQQTHLANYHAGIVLRRALFRQPAKMQADLVPTALFCDPQIATIGLSERQARERGGKPNILRWPFSENDRAQTERDLDGLIKVVTDSKGQILGAGICGAGAGDLINIWSLAIAQGLNIKDLANVVMPYPTRAEISRRVALTSYAASLRNPWLSRILRFLRWFG